MQRIFRKVFKPDGILMSEFVRHEACPTCDSSDNLARYSDGHAVCFSSDCNHYERAVAGWEPSSTQQPTSHSYIKGTMEMTGVIAAIPDRRISKPTCAKFDVRVEYGTKGEITKHHYPFKDMETGETSAVKVKTVATKQFWFAGSSPDATKSLGLFGQNTCRGKGKFITITEGELDCLSVSEIFDRKYDVVSLRAGAASAKKEIQAHLEFLENYESVVLCFDNDKAGLAAVNSVKDLFSPNKLKICKLPLKDASDMLTANRVKDFTAAWWDSKTYRPDGIVAGTDTWEKLTESRKVKSIPYPWQDLNELTKGIRRYELVTITSGSGMGKSQMVRELEYYLFKETKDNIGILALEEDISRSALGIMSIQANRPLHLEEETDTQTLKPYWDDTLGSGRFFLLDHWGSTGEDNLMSKIRYMAKSLDCKWIILDHLSIVVSSQDNGDERKAIDSIMTNLRTLVQELGIGLFLISHLKRSSGQSHEDGGRISLSELRGSQSIAQLSDIVLGMERDQQHENEEIRNTTVVRVLKNRYTGLTGPACYLKYDKFTGRLTETSNPAEDTANGF